MAVKMGATTMSSAKVGSSAVAKIYLGSSVVYTAS